MFIKDMTNDFSENKTIEQNDCLLTEEQLRQLQQELSSEAYDFTVTTIQDKHKAIVLSAAARLDVILEKILKKLMQPCSGNADNLFDTERPLSSFSAKINLAYRLGVIDSNFEHALQMVRKIRNRFAHSKTVLNLSSSPYKDWVNELVRDVKKDGNSFDSMAEGLKEANYSSDLTDFASAVIILLCQLGMLEAVSVRLEPIKKAELNESRFVQDNNG